MNKLIAYSFILLLCSTSVFLTDVKAQERLSGLSTNPDVINKVNTTTKSLLKSSKATDTITSLPFIDDFSSATILPDKSLWIDNKVYINSTYAIDPPSIGVATLDAIDETGHIYRAETKTFYADELTSRPINLSSTMSKVFLSFYYQAGGVGFVPVNEDLLTVDFFNPTTRNWIKKWPADDIKLVKQMPGYSENSFNRIFISVDTAFLKKGFQFRFRNLVTLDASQYAGKHGNASIWNIDYVKLEAGADTSVKTFQDVAIIKQPSSLLFTYESMPWQHFLKAYQTELDSTIWVTVKNHDSETRLVDWPTFQIREKTKPITERHFFTELFAYSSNIPNQSTRTLSTDLINPFEPYLSKADTITFEVKTVLTTDKEDYHANDTCRFKQIFANYMAYDDGSAEAGYGVYGDGAEKARIAYAFNAYATDTLRGIQFYFAPTEMDTTESYEFIIEVLDDNKGTPGGVIKKSNIFKPEIGTLNRFYTYMLDSGIVVSGRFYIGWEQTTNDFLSVGIDLNNNNSNKLFLNFNGTWQNSAVNGSLMLRPVFRNAKAGFSTGKKPAPVTRSFEIYPNPVTHALNVQTGITISRPLTANIYSVSGKLIKSAEFSGNSINVSELPSGLYILHLSGENITFAPVKFLIQR